MRSSSRGLFTTRGALKTQGSYLPNFLNPFYQFHIPLFLSLTVPLILFLVPSLSIPPFVVISAPTLSQLKRALSRSLEKAAPPLGRLCGGPSS